MTTMTTQTHVTSTTWQAGDTAFFEGYRAEVMAVYPSGLHEIWVFNQVVRCSEHDLSKTLPKTELDTLADDCQRLRMRPEDDTTRGLLMAAYGRFLDAWLRQNRGGK